jgi:hypothetical protein
MVASCAAGGGLAKYRRIHEWRTMIKWMEIVRDADF